jgi:hypothetical protein
MKKIDKDIVVNIIKDVKEEYNVKNKNFEIFVIQKVFDMPIFNGKYQLTPRRTAYPFRPIVLQDRNNKNIEAYYNTDIKDLEITYNSRRRHKSGHKIYSQFEIDIIRAYSNLLNENKTFEEFSKALPEFIQNYGAYNQIKAIEHLEQENQIFENLAPIIALIRVETELNNKKQDKDIDFANNWLQESNKEYDIDLINNLFTATYENSLYPNKSVRPSGIMSHKDENQDGIDDIGLATLRDIENYYNPKDSSTLDNIKKDSFVSSDFVRNKTYTGIIIDPNLTPAESAKKIFAINYENYRSILKEDIENIALTKSLEEICENLPIQEALDRIIKIYPEMERLPSSELHYDVSIGTLPNKSDQALKDMTELMNDINKTGLIDDITYADMHNLFRDPDNLLEITANEKKVTLTISDESDVLFKYIFLEKDYYGLKVLSPKTIYIKTGTTQEGYQSSLDMLAEYAYTNNCLIHARSTAISTDHLFDGFSNRLESKYKNEILYIEDSADADEHLNILMGLKKELGDNIKHKDLIVVLNKLNNIDIYSKMPNDIYEEILNEFKSKTNKLKNK